MKSLVTLKWNEDFKFDEPGRQAIEQLLSALPALRTIELYSCIHSQTERTSLIWSAAARQVKLVLTDPEISSDSDLEIEYESDEDDSNSQAESNYD